MVDIWSGLVGSGKSLTLKMLRDLQADDNSDCQIRGLYFR